MNKSKIFDCITFFDENFLTNLRFEILDEVVDNFIVCESKFDHKGNPKPINFFLTNHKFKNKVRHLIIEEQFPDLSNGWLAESYQREKIFDALKDATMEDYILFSDSDEIPNPKKLKNLSFKKKFAIFLQRFFVYKMNIYNKHEPFWKFKTEKSIEIIEEGGWHFNNLYNFETISKKIKTFPHKEYDIEKFTNIENIKKRINNMEDIFDREYKFEKISIDQTYPEYVKKNIELFRDYLI